MNMEDGKFIWQRENRKNEFKAKMKKIIWLSYGIILLTLLGISSSSFFRESFQAEEAVEIEFEEGDPEVRQISKSFRLSRGVYRIMVDYEAGTSNNYIFAESKNSPQKTGCDKILLERAKGQETFLVWVSGNVDDLTVMSEYMGVGSFYISHIEICETMLGRLHDVFLAIVFCVILFFCLNLGMEKKLLCFKGVPVVVGLAAMIMLVSLPLLAKGVYIGHDSGFHLNRVEGIWQGLKSGQLPVRIQPNWLHGYGYGVSVCYGDILLYIPAFLRMFGFSVQEAYEWFVFLINGATALTSYYCFNKMSGNKKAALTCSFLYTFSVYRIVNVYVRAAVGEYCAMIFLPVVLYGFWCILGKEEKEKKNWLPLMIGLSGLLQTHMLSCEMVGIFGIFVCLIRLKSVLQKENLKAFAKAAAGTVLLNAWFLVPFLDYMLRERLRINSGSLAETKIQDTGASIGELFKIFMYGSGSGGAAGTMPKGIGLGFLLAIFFCSAIWIENRKEKQSAKAAGFLLLGAGAALICSTKYFPWDFLIQSGAGFLASLQFPWRFLGLAVVFLCGAVCCCAHVFEGEAKKRMLNISLSVLAGAALLSSGYTMLTFMDSENLEECYEQRDAPYYVSGGEYLPSDIALSEDAFHALEPVSQNLEIYNYEKNYNRITMECENLLEEENVFQVPLLLYRGYQAYDVDTKENFPMLRTENGMTGIGLPANYQGKICMEFQEPFLWRAADLISIICFLVLICWKKGAKFVQRLWQHKGTNRVIAKP